MIYAIRNYRRDVLQAAAGNPYIHCYSDDALQAAAGDPHRAWIRQTQVR